LLAACAVEAFEHVFAVRFCNAGAVVDDIDDRLSVGGPVDGKRDGSAAGAVSQRVDQQVGDCRIHQYRIDPGLNRLFGNLCDQLRTAFIEKRAQAPRQFA